MEKEIQENTNNIKETFLSKIEENKEIKSTTSSFIRKERNGILLAILCQFIWSIGVILMKYASQREKYTANNYSMWRSFFMVIISSLFLKQSGKKLNKFSEMKEKKWFFIRCFGIYFSFLFFLLSLEYLRAATTSCLSSSNPFIIIILSILILKEPFYFRYLFGIIICFIGSSMILLNDKRNNDNNNINININNQKNFSVGLIFIFFHIILCGLVIFAQKVCVMNKISSETQVFYTGVYNLIFAFIVCIFQQNFGLDFIVILMTFLNGVVYFSAQKVNDLVFQRMDVSKFAPTSYIQTLFVFIMCGIIYKEKFFFSDLIGSFFIVAFHFYNAFFPIQSKNVVNN